MIRFLTRAGGAFVNLHASSLSAIQPSVKYAMSMEFKQSTEPFRIGWWIYNQNDSKPIELKAERLEDLLTTFKPWSFEEDPLFRRLLDRSISATIEDAIAGRGEHPVLLGMAARWRQGWMPLVDGRTEQVYGRNPDPEDIFGLVRIEDGRMISTSYQPMPAHRLLTQAGGLFRFPFDVNLKVD